MAGRGMLFAEGPSACPFVALESDRDRRAGEPDPRHRCYAEPTPAPRALAHQREYCLSAGFGGCPIFQDWAVRAAARPVPLRPLSTPTDEPAPEPGEPQQLPAFGALPEDRAAGAPEQPPVPTAPLSSPIIPPPAPAGDSATGDSATGRSLDPKPVERIPSLPLDAPEPVRLPASEPLPEAPAEPPPSPPPASSEAKPRARPRWTDDWPPSAASGGAPPAGTSGAAASGWLTPAATPPLSDPPPAGTNAEAGTGEAPPPAFLAGRRSQIEVGRPLRRRASREERPSKRDEWSAQRADLIPAWERERYAAYPGLRTRLGLGDGDALLSRLTRVLGVVAIAAVAIALLLLAPGFFAGGPIASPSPTVSPSPIGPTPTPPPTATPQPTISFESYTVRAGDTLSAIAVEFGLLPCQIMAANPQITDPNLIQIGQVILIPPDDFQLEECTAPPTP